MKIAKEFILRNIGGEAILIPTGAASQEFNGIINLSATAEFIWQNLERAGSFDDLVAMVLDEFEADEQTVRLDTEEFLLHLLNQGMIQLTDKSKNW